MAGRCIMTPQKAGESAQKLETEIVGWFTSPLSGMGPSPGTKLDMDIRTSLKLSRCPKNIKLCKLI